MGAALRAGPRPRDRARARQARAPAAPDADRRGDGARARPLRRGVPGVAGQDLQLHGRRARRAVGGLGLLGRPGLAAGHPARPGRAGPAADPRRLRAQGPPGRRDLGAAGAGEARDRALLLREPDPAGDRRGPRRDRVPHLPAAHEGRPAPQEPAPGRQPPVAFSAPSPP